MAADSGESGNEAARRAFGETTPPSAPMPSAPVPPASVSPTPYPAAPPVVPAPAAAASSDVRLSGWWRRAGALVIDGIVSGLLAYGASVAIGFAIGLSLAEMGAEPDPEGDGWVIASAIVSLVVTTLYAPLLMARSGARNGQTVGKQALGIRVVRLGGEPVTFSNGVLRQAVGQTLLMAVTLYVWALVDYLWPLGDARNQALHDKIAKTLVVHADATFSPAAPSSSPPPPPPPASSWEAPEAPVQGWLPPRSPGT